MSAIVAIAIVGASCTAGTGPDIGSRDTHATTGTAHIEPIEFATYVRQADAVLEITDIVLGQFVEGPDVPIPTFTRRFEASVVTAPLIPSNVLAIPERLELVERSRSEQFGIDDAVGEDRVLLLIDGGGQLAMRPPPPLRVVLVVGTGERGTEVLGPQPYWDGPVDLDAAATRFNDTHATDLTGTALLVAWVGASAGSGDTTRFEEAWRSVRDGR